MFEDFKEKIREHKEKINESSTEAGYSPEVLSNLKKRGIDPDNFTLSQLFPPLIDEEGNDMSLMSGAETDLMVTFAELRKYLVEKYPQSRQEAKTLGVVWDEEPEEPKQLNIAAAKVDPKSRQYFQGLLKMRAIFDKIAVLQTHASEYEKICLRFYWHLSYNWNHAPKREDFRNTFLKCKSDIFEIVEAYFKICRKYHVPVSEEPYCFLSDELKREIKLEGDMLRRTSDYSDFEIRLSILEGIP
jgi:hypothetical protein